MPTSIATITVRVANTSPLFGRVNPTASKSLNSPLASPSPTNSPTSEAIVPTTSASTMIERSTCRRLAPSVRSVASSRVRCAIVIESEFAITKLPTKSAMPPNASRKPAQERDERVRVLRVLCGLLLPRQRLCVGRQDRLHLTQCGPSTRRLSWSRSRSRRTGSSCRTGVCAVGTSKPASVAPPIWLRPPNLTRPEMRRLARSGPAAWTPTTSPTVKCFLFAVLESITTWSPCGQAPATSVRGLNRDAPFAIEKPRFGAPPNAIAFPSCADQVRFAVDAGPRLARRPAGCRTWLEQRRRQRRSGRAVVRAGRGLAGDHDVGSLAARP